jgi:hypothetical protein
MPNSAELSSLATAVDELIQRITTLADAAASAKDEAVAGELYEAERALRSAGRRLASLSRG